MGLAIAGIYAVIGVLFALAFVVRGAGVIDPSAKGAPIGFRLLIFPASVLLWPLLAARWAGAGGSKA